MDMNRAMGGKHLKADELGAGWRATAIIDEVRLEEFGTGDDAKTKPVMYFRGKDKGLVLNKTNINTLIDLFGTAESDDWCGRSIGLYTTKVEYAGKRVLGIRVEVPRARHESRPAPPPPAPDPVDDAPLTADDIQF